MTLTPCGRCPKRKDCVRRAEVVAGIRGLRLGSVKFTCDEYFDQFKPGMRITTSLRPGELWFKGNDAFYGFIATGTVMAWKDRKVLVCIDEQFTAKPVVGCKDIHQPDGTVSRAVLKLWPDRLLATGGTVPICRNCRKPMHVAVADWLCEKNIPADNQPPCVAGDPEDYWRQKLEAHDA